MINDCPATELMEQANTFTFRFDLEVTALSAYVPYNASLNGLNGRFAQISLAANEEDSEVKFEETIPEDCLVQGAAGGLDISRPRR